LLAAIRSCQYRVSSWVQLRVESRTSRLFAPLREGYNSPLAQSFLAMV